VSGVLVLAESRGGELRGVTFELAAAAASVRDQVGGPVRVALIERDPGRHTDALAAAGADELLLVPGVTEHLEANVTARALEMLIDAEQPALVLAAHTVDGLGVAPAVAARRGLGFATNVTAIRWDGGLVARRRASDAGLEEEVALPGDRPALLTVRPGSFAAPAPAPARAPLPPAIREVELALTDAAATEHIGFRQPAAGEVEIARARFLLSVGRGVGDAEGVRRFEQLAGRLHAALTASRPVIDAGWIPRTRSVGQSSRAVKPRVYLALGISGAVPHLAGIRGADTVIAVNTDPEAPIFSVADYGAVVDMFELADGLTRRLDQTGHSVYSNGSPIS
jgi:electron transfer flavoprotein alpha subunit